MQWASTQRIYTHISIQVTVDHAEHQGEVGAWGVAKSSQCLGKSCILAEFCLYWYLWAWLSVVVLCLRPIIKVYLLVACVFMYSRDSTRQRAHVRELKVILMLVLGWHECVQGKFYININKLVFSKSVLQGWSCLTRAGLGPERLGPGPG